MKRRPEFPIEPNTAITAWINEGLKKSGKTQRDLARALGIDPASVNRILKGARKLRVDEMEPAARFLGIELPRGYLAGQHPFAPVSINLPTELRTAVVAKALEMSIEPEDFILRAVRAALVLAGSKVGGTRY